MLAALLMANAVFLPADPPRADDEWKKLVGHWRLYKHNGKSRDDPEVEFPETMSLAHWIIEKGKMT